MRKTFQERNTVQTISLYIPHICIFIVASIIEKVSVYLNFTQILEFFCKDSIMFDKPIDWLSVSYDSLHVQSDGLERAYSCHCYLGHLDQLFSLNCQDGHNDSNLPTH